MLAQFMSVMGVLPHQLARGSKTQTLSPSRLCPPGSLQKCQLRV